MILKNDIEKVYKQRNWWDLVINLKFSTIITYLIANKTNLTPNQVTLLSLIFAIISGVFFYFHFNILGAIFFQISYIFDIVDGALARVTRQTSKFGEFFDVFTDWLKAPLLIVIVLFNKYIYLVIILFLLYLLCLVNKYNDKLFYEGAKSVSNSIEISVSKIGKYLNFMKSINIQPFPSTVEMEALLLFFYPIFQKDIFIYLAIVVLFFQILIKLYAIIKKIK